MQYNYQEFHSVDNYASLMKKIYSEMIVKNDV